MAYPEPIPPIRSKDAKEFQQRLGKFKITSAQRAAFEKAKADYKESLKSK